MINTLIFDFGNVFINLDLVKGTEAFLNTLGIDALPDHCIETNNAYEVGAISTNAFINYYIKAFPHVSKTDFITAWNAILREFPIERLEFLKQLQSNTSYKLILLSNTNTLHIDWIKTNIAFYETFKNCFDAFYLSHEINLRKPNASIYNFVLTSHNLKPEQCLFIDDNADNIASANSININTWHITPYEENVTTLFDTKSHLF